MSAPLSYTLQNKQLHIKVTDIWRLTVGSKKSHAANSAQQENIIKIIQAQQCSNIILEFLDSQDTAINNVNQNKNNKIDKDILIKKDTKKTWDSLLLTFFAVIIEEAKKVNISIDDSQLPHQMSVLLGVELLGNDKVQEPENSILVNIGESVLIIPKSATNALAFLGEVSAALGTFFRGKASCSARDVWQEIYACSVASLPIISLVSLLLGLILAFVSAIQLRTLGAELYVASLVSISMVRVMGPVLTGIVVAGKTGASYAATLGTMQVNEEVDALNTFGISPIEFLILPRVLALTIMMPFLTMYSNAMGVLGGFLVCVVGLGISPSAFVENVQFMASMEYLWIGLFHAFVFGFLIALAGCYQGLMCGRSAEAVGKATTAAVVNAIVGIIVATSIITIILSINNM